MQVDSFSILRLCIHFRVTDATELFRNDSKPCAGVFAKLLMTQFTSKEVMSYECPLR